MAVQWYTMKWLNALDWQKRIRIEQPVVNSFLNHELILYPSILFPPPPTV